MSIMQRPMQPSSSVNGRSTNASGSTTTSRSKSRVSSVNGRVQQIKSKREVKQKKRATHNRLLWLIGGIATLIVFLNYAQSLKHNGILPSGVSFTLNFHGRQSKWVIGTAPQEGEDAVQEFNTLGHPHRNEKLRSRLDEASRHKQEELNVAASHITRHRLSVDNNDYPSKDATHRLVSKSDNHRSSRARLNNQLPVRRSSGKKFAESLQATGSANRKGATSSQKNTFLEGRKNVHEKEAKKGDVHPIKYYLALSRREGHDKEHLLKLIRDNAGIQFLSETTYNDLPKFSEVKEMYGDHPRLVAKEQCAAFQASGDLGDKFLGVAGAFNSGTNFLAKTITRNCVLHKRQEKYGIKNRGIRWQVPYGKHSPPGDPIFRNSHVAQKSGGVEASQVLPVVMIRDPFRWLQSMCSHHYTSRWPRVFRRKDPRYHCPNLFPTADEKARLAALEQEPLLEGQYLKKETPNHKVPHDWTVERALYVGIRPDTRNSSSSGKQDIENGYRLEGGDQENEEVVEELPRIEVEPDTSVLSDEELRQHNFPVHVKYSNFTRHHRSLVHLWNEWYQEYLDLEDYPHIFVRMEDLLFFPDQVIPQICECAGGKLLREPNKDGKNHPVRVIAQSAKEMHSTKFMQEGEEHTGYIDALIKYGHGATRFKGMTPHDLQYARRYLDQNNMELFGYGYPHESLMAASHQGRG